jgi:hypothetical protein
VVGAAVAGPPERDPGEDGELDGGEQHDAPDGEGGTHGGDCASAALLAAADQAVDARQHPGAERDDHGQAHQRASMLSADDVITC